MVLEVKNVQYSYKSQKEKEIFKNVSMQFEEKKFYTIVGASGAGKTTFLSLLAGLDLPVRGTILYDGEDIQEKGLNYHRKHHVSLVFQNYNLIDYLTTEENVRLGGTKNPQDLLEKVNIPCEDWKRNVLQLSGGQQQRVAIARALASNAKVLLADEPTGNLDPKNSWDIMNLLEKINNNGTTVLVVTHNREIVNAMQKRVITMKKGIIVSDEEKGGYIDEN